MKSKINISKMISNKVKHLQKDKLYNYSIFNDILEKYGISFEAYTKRVEEKKVILEHGFQVSYHG